MTTTLPAPSAAARSGLRAWIARRPLLAFVALAYLLTWPYLAVEALASWDLIPFRLPMLLMLPMGYGPTFAALIVVGVMRGRAGIGELLRPLKIWRVGLRWYLVTLLGVGVLAALTMAIYMAIGGPPLERPPLSWALVGNALALFLIGGVLNGEEIGWRGFALPYLQARHSALVASLIVGLFWALFHLPLFFMNGDSFASTPPLAFLARILASSVLFTWIFNSTRGSLLIAYLLHAATNTWPRIIPIDGLVGSYAWLVCGISCLAALALVAAYGPARLAHAPAVKRFGESDVDAA
jgi:uncharacterized protein